MPCWTVDGHSASVTECQARQIRSGHSESVPNARQAIVAGHSASVPNARPEIWSHHSGSVPSTRQQAGLSDQIRPEVWSGDLGLVPNARQAIVAGHSGFLESGITV